MIVGVGNADFTEINALDSDNGFLTHNGVTAVHDIVQFVPFKDFANNHEDLARTTLREIPGQVMAAFRQYGYVPHLPRPRQ